MKANETMNMMELNEEQLEAVTGGGILDDIMDAINSVTDKIFDFVDSL